MSNSKYITNRSGFSFWEWWLLLSALGVVVLSGCAGYQCHLPRIDPSGEHIFLPYNAPEPPAYRPPARSGAPTLVMPTPPLTFPTSPPSAPTIPVEPVPPAPTIPPLPNPYIANPDPTGVTITPARIVAPIGSEVILLASVLGGDGYMVTGEPVEWTVNPLGVGNIVALGERGRFDWIEHLHGFPRKLTDHYALTKTCVADMYLDRGTPSPTDDVTVLPGQTWISVTSPVEGTSHITALAASTYNWERRQQTAQIHWIDAQFSFPNPTSGAAGSRVPLTTKVNRLTNGTPLEGWIVRYELVPGGPAAALEASSYNDSAPKLSGGQAAEATTNAQGEATVDLVQEKESGGVSAISVQVFRPAGLAPGETQRVPLGQGATSVSWTGAPIGATTSPSQPALAPANTPSRRTDDTPPPRLSGQARLNVDITGPTVGTVGDELDFQIVITNTGDEVATNVKLRDGFDKDLELIVEPGEPRQPSPISADVKDIDPGKRRTVRLPLRALAAGRQCQNVTAVADNQVRSNAAEICTNVRDKAGRSGADDRFETPPSRFGAGNVKNPVSISIRGPELRKVGETAEFFVTVTNNSSDLARGIKLIFDYDRGFAPKLASVDMTPSSEGYTSALGDLMPGKSVNVQINCECVRAAPRACIRAKANVREIGTVSDEKCLEIQEDDNPPAPTLSDASSNRGQNAFGEPTTPRDRFERPPPIGSSPSGPIKVTLTRQEDSVRVGQITHFHAEIQNTSQQDFTDVAVQFNTPLGLTPRKVEGLTDYRPSATGFEVGPIRLLRAGETVALDLQFSPDRPGRKALELKIQPKDRRLDAVSASDTIDVVQ
jgi:uncharacterized repeat protein (TIGR01451 family)